MKSSYPGKGNDLQPGLFDIHDRLGKLDNNQDPLQRDQLSFMGFLNLILGDRVPDSKTIWFFRDQRTKANLNEKLFVEFDGLLDLGNHTRNLLYGSGKEVVRIQSSFRTAGSAPLSTDRHSVVEYLQSPEVWQ